MFLITETETEAIRRVLRDHGELSAAVALREQFPGITDLAAARRCVRALASAPSAPPPSLPEIRLPPGAQPGD